MDRITRLLAVTILALAVPVVALAGDAALKDQIEQWEKRFNAGDAAGVAALYTEDAQILPPGSDIVEGRTAIQEFWQMAIDGSAGEDSLETLELHELGDVAVEIGTYSEEGGDNGKYMVVWKKTDDGWLIHRDLWNSSAGDE